MRVKALGITAMVLGIAMLVPCVNIFAQQPPKPAQTQSAKKQHETVLGKADLMKSAWGDKKTVLMKGNVKFTHGDTLLTSDQVEYDQTAKTAVSPGKVVITNPDSDVSGSKGNLYFQKRIGVLEGSVVMHIKPKAQDKPADKESVRAKLNELTTITCEKLEYQYKAKIATATGSVVFKQEKRSASADKAVYDESKELLTLTGNVRSVDENDQTFTAPGTVVISLKKGDEWMEAKDANASFKIDLGDEDQ